MRRFLPLLILFLPLLASLGVAQAQTLAPYSDLLIYNVWVRPTAAAPAEGATPEPPLKLEMPEPVNAVKEPDAAMALVPMKQDTKDAAVAQADETDADAVVGTQDAAGAQGGGQAGEGGRLRKSSSVHGQIPPERDGWYVLRGALYTRGGTAS